MFGPDWLVAPVTTYKAETWKVYLPALPPDGSWVYFYNQTAMGPWLQNIEPFCRHYLLDLFLFTPSIIISPVSNRVWQVDRDCHTHRRVPALFPPTGVSPATSNNPLLMSGKLPFYNH